MQPPQNAICGNDQCYLEHKTTGTVTATDLCYFIEPVTYWNRCQVHGSHLCVLLRHHQIPFVFRFFSNLNAVLLKPGHWLCVPTTNQKNDSAATCSTEETFDGVCFVSSMEIECKKANPVVVKKTNTKSALHVARPTWVEAAWCRCITSRSYDMGLEIRRSCKRGWTLAIPAGVPVVLDGKFRNT